MEWQPFVPIMSQVLNILVNFKLWRCDDVFLLGEVEVKEAEVAAVEREGDAAR